MDVIERHLYKVNYTYSYIAVVGSGHKNIVACTAEIAERFLIDMFRKQYSRIQDFQIEVTAILVSRNIQII